MLEEEASDTGEDVPPRLPQQSALLWRAHELLESNGQPLSEDILIKHLFGVAGKTAKRCLMSMSSDKGCPLLSNSSCARHNKALCCGNRGGTSSPVSLASSSSIVSIPYHTANK